MFSLPFHVAKSIDIGKPIAEVFLAVADFHTWKVWSPWLCQEPDCVVKITGKAGTEGHGQSWDGKTIGSGSMQLANVQENAALHYELEFLKPWKSQSKVSFEFTRVADKTRLTWQMHGTLPVFLFFMRKMMSAWVGNDYERGLKMLKEFLEIGKVRSQVDFSGEVDRQGFHYLGKRRVCATGDLGPTMKADFEKLDQLLSRGEAPKPEFMFALYHNFDLVKGQCEYTSGFAYGDRPKVSDSSLATGRLNDHRALKVTHKGAYDHLGNGWATAMSWQRSLKRKPQKEIPMYEVYVNTPGEVEDEKLLTEIFIPVK